MIPHWGDTNNPLSTIEPNRWKRFRPLLYLLIVVAAVFIGQQFTIGAGQVTSTDAAIKILKGTNLVAGTTPPLPLTSGIQFSPNDTDPHKAAKAGIFDRTDIIQGAIIEFTNDADQAVWRMQDEITKSGIRLIIPATTKVGFTETLRVATEAGVSPTLDFLCPDGGAVKNTVALIETTTAGIYSAEMKFDAFTFKCAVAKAVTVVASVSIPSKDPSDPPVTATAVGSIFLVTATNDDVLAAASAGMNAEKAAQDAKEAIRKVAKALSGEGSTMSALTNLQQRVGKIPSLLNQDRSGMGQIRRTLDKVSDQLNTFIGKSGYDFRSILKSEIGEGIRGVTNKVARIDASTEVMKKIMVQKTEEPIVQTLYEIA